MLPRRELKHIAVLGAKRRIGLSHVPNECSCSFAAVYCQLWEGEAGAEA